MAREPDERRSTLTQPRTIVGAALAVLLIVFAILNSQDVEVDWIFTTSDTPLVIVMAVCGLLGFLVGRLLEWQRTRHR